MKSILSYESWRSAKFSIEDDYRQYHELMEKCSHLFASIPSTEVWSIENITSTLHQIEFYRVTGSLRSNDDARILLDKFDVLIDHLELQAEYGVKLKQGQAPVTGTTSFKLFVNELLMGDNMHVIQLGNRHFTFLNHCVMNYISTADDSFNEYAKKTIDNIAQKSTLISGVNERERLVFFNKLRAKIRAARQLIVD